MPAYHSAFNQVEAHVIGSFGVYPVKTAIRGPAPALTTDEIDIIDETLDFFRANVLFRNFEVKGPADVLLIYLTLFTQQCIKRVERDKITSKAKAFMALKTLAQENFKLPGDAGFAVPGIMKAPASREESDNMRAYLKQLREELIGRLVEKLFIGEDQRNKWWMCFSKRKFMDRSLGP